MKKDSMKKLFLFFCMLSISLCCFGCSKQKESTASTGEEKVEIEFYYGLGGELGEQVEKRIENFNQENNKYKIIPVVQGNYDETLQALQAALAAGKPPALALNGYAEFLKLADSEVLASLDEYVDRPEYEKEDMIKSILDQGIFNDTYLGVPAFASTQVMYYRKDVFDDLNIEFDKIKDFEELVEISKRIKDEKDMYGWSIMCYTEHMVDYARSTGGDVISADGKEILIDSDEWIYSWDLIRKSINDGQTMNSIYEGDGWQYWYKTIDNVLNGLSAGYTGSAGDGGNLDFDIVSTGMQKGFNGSEPRPVAISVLFNIFDGITDEQKEGAWEFINYFTAAENTATWSLNTGYLPVRSSAIETEIYIEELEKNPSAAVPIQQAEKYGIPPFVDPTGGKIFTILDNASERLIIENIPAKEVLENAKKEAQNELDKVIN